MTTTKKEPEVVTTKKDQHEKEPEVVNTKKEPEVVTTKKDPEVVNTKKNRKWPLTFDLWPLTLTRKKTNLLLTEPVFGSGPYERLKKKIVFPHSKAFTDNVF